MSTTPVNATGWSELIEGKMVNAVYTMFDTAFGSMGMVVVMLFVVYQIMLFAKTRNPTLMWITGVFFVSLYALSIYVEEFAIQILFLILVFEFASIMWMMLFVKS